MEHNQIEINSVEDIKTYMISYNERIAQFDITPVYLKDHELIEVERLDNKNRGGYGTTGVE